MGRHSFPGDNFSESDDDDDTPSGRIARSDGAWQGRRRRADAGRRGVSAGVVVALVAVVLLVGGLIVWRFFGHALSRRSTDAARQCLQGTAAVAVVADPSIAETVEGFAESFNDEGHLVGDQCMKVTVTKGDSDAVISGLTGTWPADLGEQPALWIPASSIGSARLQEVAGKQIVSDARSLVTSPVVLAVRPQLKDALGQQGWAALPGLQSNPAALDGLNLPGWGSLRLALPTVGAADAAALVAEAVAIASAPPEAPTTPQLGAVTTLVAGQPRLTDNTANAAWDALLAPGEPAPAPVHAVALTEQQLFQRTSGLRDAKDVVAEWFPNGPVALADYPTVLLSGDWLQEEQVSAASEFARFMRKPDRSAEFTKAGFRIPDGEGKPPEGNDVVAFGSMGAPLPVGDDAARTAIAGLVSPGGAATTTVMLNENLAAATPALKSRLSGLPPNAAVGLWTFNGLDSGMLVPTGPLAEDIGGSPRSAALAGALDGVVAFSDRGGVSFTTLRLIYADALANYRPGQLNSILVITKGPHSDQTLDGPGLQEFIKASLDPNRPVAVNVIDIGDDPDRATWEAVAQLTGGSYQAVSNADSPEAAAAIARMVS
ncbi:MAG: substrate-binding domain-containing protein [Mycobacterium sp.]|nr:substrate-binding domain-containing protein [Mycobacterium sp.]